MHSFGIKVEFFGISDSVIVTSYIGSIPFLRRTFEVHLSTQPFIAITALISRNTFKWSCEPVATADND